MSVSKTMLLVFFLLYRFQGFKGNKKSDLDNVVYVSRAHGQSKDDSCGSMALPCKALQVGIDKLAWDGLLYIDGDQTTTNPYSCESSSGKVVAKRSLHVRSYNTMAHISCPNGFWISADIGSKGLDVTITGIQFKNTVLYLRNVSNVTIQYCTFLESSPAIDSVTSSGSALDYLLNIKSVLFRKNRGCIFFQCQFNNSKRRLNRAKLDLTNVTFEENLAGRGQKRDVRGGLVFVKLTNCSCKKMCFESMWENVKAIRNSISNITADTSNSNTSFTGKGFRQHPILDSLYVVYACNASLKFNQVRSNHSSRLRFLSLRSRHSSVRIYKSCFHGHRIWGPGGVIYIPNGHLIDIDISHSDFTNNGATVGGVIQIDGGDSKTAILTFSNVNIRKCFGAKIGCAISVGEIDTNKGITNVLLTLNGVLFKHCHWNPFMGREYGPLCIMTTRKTNVIIRNSIFDSNASLNPVVYIKHSPKIYVYDDSILNLEVTKSRFNKNNCYYYRPSILHLDARNPSMIKRSRLMISDSVFTWNSGNVINVFNVQEIKIHNFTCKHTNRGACFRFVKKMVGNLSPGSKNSLIIEKSTLLNNIRSIYVKFEESSLVNVQVHDTVIKDSVNWEQVVLVFGETFLPMINLSFNGQVLFQHVDFISNKNHRLFVIYVSRVHNGNVSFVFRQSVFRKNFHKDKYFNQYEESALFLFQSPPDISPGKSSFCKHPLHPSCIYRNTFIFDEVIFENNIGSSFIVHIANGKTLFRKCIFKNNYSRKPKTGGHLFIQQGTASVQFDNTTFIQTKVKSNYSMLFVFAGGSGPLILRNSKFLSEDSSKRINKQLTIQSEGYVFIDKITELLCPVGSYMEIENGSHLIDQSPYRLNITRLKFTCNMCGVGKYTMERGSYKGRLSPTKCIEFCPFGAECTWNIQSRPNFWGYYTSRDPPQLNFTRCHEKYCHVPKSMITDTSVYNACFGNRTGVMCGACKEGFTESMFNHKCRPYEECRDVWFWVITGLYSIIMACYFLLQPPVMSYLINNLLWFRKKKPSIQNSTCGEEETKEHDGHGYSKIIFYFYQVADLLMLESASEILHSSNFISTIISFYNFQIELADSKLGCPFPGLTAVTKELFRSAQVFTVMAFILVFYFLHWLLSLFRTTFRPVFAPYLAAIVDVLLLGYERLGHTSLNLLNCVPIKVRGKVERRLVLDGNIVCWSNWWQYCLIAYNIIFVTPFLLVLLIGTSKLRSQRITPIHFVAACFLPLPFVTYWLIKMCCRRALDETHDNTTQSVQENSSRKALMEVLQEPFRPPDNQSRGAYYWESVLIGRRLIYLCLYSFVSTPMLRMLFMTAVCFAIPVHNIIVMPYKDRKTNIFGIIMVSFHVALAIINLCKSVFITIGVTAVGPTRSQIDGLQFFEAALLGFLPCMFVILVVATVISQVFRFSVLILRMIQRCIMHYKRGSENNSGDDTHQTLSNPTEEDSMSYDDIQY